MKTQGLKIHLKINHNAHVANCIKLIRYGRSKGLFGVDISPYTGVQPYYTDPENCSIFRNTPFEIACETFDFDSESALGFARERDALTDEQTVNGR